MQSFNVHYESVSTDLCEIGRKYDTDKTSQRDNRSDGRHCHAYTCFYEALFSSQRNTPLDIAELGVLEGSSIRMWKDFFPQANLVGFDNNHDFMNYYRDNYDMDRISLFHMDVYHEESISGALRDTNKQYDIIIEDTTHQFQDQIRVIFQSYSFLKPGGILIVEDIYRSYSEDDYKKALQPILSHFQDYYFVDLDHKNRISTGWNNDKVFVLVKGGAEPIFKNHNRITMITPSCRWSNLTTIEKSVNFDYVEEWIIVYDGNHVSTIPDIFNDHPHKDKIKQYVVTDQGCSGNPQRNFALSKVSNWDTFIYFLDDDNSVHPSLYRLLDIADKGYIYTFNQENNNYVPKIQDTGLKGNDIQIGRIDTAMFLVYGSLCRDLRWDIERYDADGYYITELYRRHPNKHIWINNDMCYYNLLRPAV